MPITACLIIGDTAHARSMAAISPFAPVAASQPPADWQTQAAAARMTAHDLVAHVGLAPEDFPAGVITALEFPVRVPPHFLAQIRPGDPTDPLLRQVLARGEERWPQPDRHIDPLHEADYRVTPGLLRKYRSRALLMASGACAIHCRYCFRQHTDYGSAVLTRTRETAALGLIAADPQIEEVILSGGDPLSLPDDRLIALVARIAAIPHVGTLRIHTRTLVAIPARVTEALLAFVRNTQLRVVIVLHSNHAQELSSEVAAAMKALRSAGATLLNQSVLLSGVNDDAATIAAHCRRLFACGVLPYYMHLLDPVAGSVHFDVDEPRARSIEADLRTILPGYLMPRFVREVPGEASKTPLTLL